MKNTVRYVIQKIRKGNFFCSSFLPAMRTKISFKMMVTIFTMNTAYNS
jgi:hypothetical protein